MKSPKLGGYRPPVIAAANSKKYLAGKIESLPSKVDLRKFMTAVEEQVGSSCVANALAGAYEYIAKREMQDESDVSRLFVYYNARYFADSQDEDAGSYMQYAIKGLQEYGACSESNWANDEDLILQEPHPEAYAEGENFKITDSQALETDLDVWRNALSEGHPIAFALNTFDSFDDACKNKGRVPMPKKNEIERETHGWHAMLAVGYSDPDKVFIVRNSWGEQWGDKGYCYIPYDYIINEKYNGNDSWIIKAIDETNYGEGVWDEDESSSFTDEDSTVIKDFYLLTSDGEGFMEDLEALVIEYTETEEDFYLDYEVSEEDEDGNFEVSMNDFYLNTSDAEGFIEAMDELCAEYAISEDDYSYTIAGDEEEEEEEEETESTVIEDFYLLTSDGEGFMEDLKALVIEYTETEEDFSLDYEISEEDEDGNFEVSMNDFNLNTSDAEGFIEAMDELCAEYAISEDDYDYTIAGYEEEEEDEEEE